MDARIRRLIALVAAAAGLVACGPRVYEPSLHAPGQADLTVGRSNFLTVHTHERELFVLDEWTVAEGPTSCRVA